MAELNDQAETIRLKVVKLLAMYRDLQQQYGLLADENQRLEKVIREQKNTISGLEETNKMIKLAGSLPFSKDESHELKKKVNAYIREIDECIRLLSDR